MEKYRLLFIIGAVIVILDQISKSWIQKTMELYQSIPVIPDFFSLTYIRNPGAAFGLFSGGDNGIRTAIFVTVSLIALGILGFLYAHTPSSGILLRVALSMVTGGAIGNLIDRIKFGEVVDFLDFYVGSYHWPAFNVADSCITIGVGLLVMHSVIHRNSDPFDVADGQ